MKTNWKCFLSWLMVACMLIGTIPMDVYATDAGVVSSEEAANEDSVVSTTGPVATITDTEGNVTEYSSLQEAVNAAVDGNVIVLHKDVEKIPHIDKAITIQGSADKYINVAGGAGEGQFGAINGTVTYQYLNFVNGTAAIRVDYQSYDTSNLKLVLKNCNFNNIGGKYAIQAGSTGVTPNVILDSLLIEGCKFTASVDATFTGSYMVYAQATKNVTITDSTFDGSDNYRGAVHLGDSIEIATTAVIKNNTIADFSRGVQIGNRVAGSNITIESNTFENIDYNSKDSKQAYECASVFIHENADATAIESVAITNNKFVDCENPAIYSEDDQARVEDFVTTFSGNKEVVAATSEETAIELKDSYYAPKAPTVTEVISGAGTVEDPYLINDLEDLKKFRDDVNTGNTYDGEFVKLTANINLSEEAWTPIGNGTNKFLGTFDGDNCTVSNLKVDVETNHAGFFGFASVVKNLNIKNATVSGVVCVGSVVGELESSVGLVENCHVTGLIQIKGENSVGGLAGKGYANIKNSSVIGDDKATSYVLGEAGGTEEGDNVGGIIGHLGEGNGLGTSNVTVKNLTISGTRKVGGVLGTTQRCNQVNGCTVSDVIIACTATSEYADDNASTTTIGGVIGNYFGSGTGGTVADCTVENVTFEAGYAKNVGAVVGGNRTTPDVTEIEGVTASNITVTNVTGTTNTYLLPVVAQIGEIGYATLAEALAVASTMTGDVSIEIYDKVTLNQNLSRSYDSITFVGKDTDAEIYLDVQGYITATGKAVAFEDLKLSKAEGGFITNAGFMNVAFGVYDVTKVTYTDCTFANGAYASSGDVTFTGCTFYRSHDKYGLWAYGDADITVDGCTFADYRGIKMYAEGAAKTTNLTVKNSDFSALTDKPAIVLTYGESVTLDGNTYSSTGVFELDLDGAPNGTPVTTDTNTITCKNDNGACGVLVDGKIYTTVAQAAAAAGAGDTVTLLHNSTETVEFAEGVILDKNGYTAAGVTVKVSLVTVDAYVSQDTHINGWTTVWGELPITGTESFYVEIYSGDTYLGKTTLVDTNKVLLDGASNQVTWYAFLDGSDSWWNTEWEVAPVSTLAPTDVKYYVDGVQIGSGVVKMTSPDDLHPVVWAELRGVIPAPITGLEGEGTEESPYLISNLAELKWFRDDVNAGNTYEGKYIKLTASIDLSGEDWTPIGTSTNHFKGNFDGGENVISNLTINGNVNYYDNGTHYVGLFGRVQNGGYIKNVTIENVNITGCLYVGALVGRVYIGGAIENCHVRGNIAIEGYWYVGGIAGRYEYATGIYGCTVDGASLARTGSYIEADADAATNADADGSYVGGIVGFVAEGAYDIENCTVSNITISGVTRVGGISGIGHYGNTISECFVNNVTLKAAEGTTTVGLIVGATQGKESEPTVFEDNTVANSTATAGDAVVTDIYGTNINGSTATTNYVAQIGSAYYETLADALAAAKDGETIELISGDQVISAAGAVYGNKTVTITGKAIFDWSKGWLFVGRGGEGDGKLIFDNATITSTEESLKNGSYGIHVSAPEKDEAEKNNGTVVFKNSTINLSYLANRGTVEVDGGKLNVVYGFWVGGRPATETPDGAAGAATMDIKNGAVVTVENHNGMGIGHESIGIVNVEEATFEYTGASFVVREGSALNVKDGTFKANKFERESGGLFSISGNSKVCVEDFSGVARLEAGTTLTDSYIKSSTNGTARAYGDLTLNGGFETGYFTTASKSLNNDTVYTGTVTIADDSTLKASCGVEINGNTTVNGGTIELSGGNASGSIWGFVVQSGTAELNCDIVVNGAVGEKVNYTPIYFTNTTATVKGKITQSKSGGEPIYITNSTVTLTEDASIETDCAVYVNDAGALKSSGNIFGTIKANATDAVIEISGGKYKQDVNEWCVEGYVALPDLNGQYVVGEEPTATINNLGAMTIAEADYKVYGGSKNGDMPLNFVMQFLADQTAEDMETSPFADWYGDFVITITGIEEGLFTADGCYLAGYYGSFGWVKVPIDGLEVKNGVRYPVMLSVGMGQKYDDICTSVKDFRCAMFLTEEILAANPNLEVKLELSLVDNSVSEDAAVNAIVAGETIYEVASLTYNVDDFLGYVASVTDSEGNVEKYETLEEALEAATTGSTITLLSDIKLEESLVFDKEGTYTIDGNGYSIAPAESYVDKQNALLLLGATGSGDEATVNHNYTIKNVVFEDTSDWSVIRSQGVTLTLDGCTIQNSNQTNGQALVRLDYTEANITNTVFQDNNALMAITHNFNTGGNSTTKLNVNECIIQNNIFNKTAAIYYVAGNGCNITNSEFIANTVNCNVNGAVIYLGFQEDCAVTGCLFKDNTVTDASTSTRVAGAIFFGYEAEISGNAFVNNTASNANGSTGIGQDVCTSTYYECDIDLSDNYFDGKQPVESVDYLVQHKTGDATFALESYYKAYSLNEDGNVVLDEKADAIYEAKINKIFYAEFEDAFAAAEDGDTITLLKDAAGAGAKIDKSLTIDLGGYTYTVNSTVGSANTVTNGFQLLRDNAITFKNGTIAAAPADQVNVGIENAKALKTLVINYADLTLEDVTLDGSNCETIQYVLSNNNGNIVLTGDTNITAPEGAVAFDVYDYTSAGYEGTNVSVNTTGVITGKIEVSETDKANLAVSGGTFTQEIQLDWCAKGYMPAKNDNGTYTVKEGTCVAVVCDENGTVVEYYNDLSTALDVAQSGDTVKLVKDCTESIVMVPAGVVLDLNGKMLTATYFVSFGDTVDGNVGGVGGVIVGQTSVVISSDYSQLPLYDSTLGGYRFFAYEVDIIGAYPDPDSSSNVQRFWFSMLFENKSGLELLQNSESTGLSIKTKLEWTGSNKEVYVPINNSLIDQWAKAELDNYDEWNGEYGGLYLSVGGMSNLETGNTVSVTPIIVLEDTRAADKRFDAMTYVVE